MIGYNNKKLTLGYYDTAKDAATAYDMAAKILYGECALTNYKQNLL